MSEMPLRQESSEGTDIAQDAGLPEQSRLGAMSVEIENEGVSAIADLLADGANIDVIYAVRAAAERASKKY